MSRHGSKQEIIYKTRGDTDVLRIGTGERYDVELLANNPGRWLLAVVEQGFTGSSKILG